MKFTHLVLATSSVALLAACGGSDAPTSASSAPSKTSAPAPATKKDIRVVGSSTVYPFSTKVAQEFKNKTGQNVVVEATGSGGGHKLFCDGDGANTADVTNSSRRQKKSEFDLCKSNGVDQIVEVKIGFDGIVVSNAIDSASIDMDLDDLYLALAKMVPTSKTDCTMITNPYTNWTQINPSLPDARIEVFGPPPTSGTRDAFVEIAMEGGAKMVDCVKALDKDAFKIASHTIREDGKWIDSGENDNALVQTLVNTPTAVGVFGYSFLDQNADKIKGATIGGVEPTFENIASGDYSVSRSLYFYLKGDKAETTPGLQAFALEFTSDAASGPGGYLEEIGLVPLPDAERAAVRARVENMTAYSQ